MEPIEWISIDALLEALSALGFNIGGDRHVRVLLVLERSAQNPAKNADNFKYRLAALICRSAAQQALFYEVYAETAALLEQETSPAGSAAAPGDTDTGKPSGEDHPNRHPPPALDLPGSGGPPPPLKTPTAPAPTPAASRTGPVRLALQFPPNPLRPWNTTAIDRALRLLREKEWANATEWDIPASIRTSIRAGGIPQFVARRRIDAPKSPLLFDQRGTRAHPAGH